MARRRKAQREELREAALERSWNLVKSYGADEDNDDDLTIADLVVDLTSSDLEVDTVEHRESIVDIRPEFIGPDTEDHLAVSTPIETDLQGDSVSSTVQAVFDEPPEAPEVVESNDEEEVDEDHPSDEEGSDAVVEPVDPIRDIGSHPTSPGPEVAALGRTLTAYQQEVVDWLGYAMSSWLEYFFVLGDGTPEERLDKAGEELARAGRRLNHTAYLISDLRDTNVSIDQALRTYTASVEMWATAVDMLSRAALARRGRFAREAFRIFEEGSSSVKPLVDTDTLGHDSTDLAGPLELLDTTNPTKRVPKKEVEAAKGPWRRALVASGSPLRALMDEGAYAHPSNDA